MQNFVSYLTYNNALSKPRLGPDSVALCGYSDQTPIVIIPFGDYAPPNWQSKSMNLDPQTYKKLLTNGRLGGFLVCCLCIDVCPICC